jgi:hypothetical protein
MWFAPAGALVLEFFPLKTRCSSVALGSFWYPRRSRQLESELALTQLQCEGITRQCSVTGMPCWCPSTCHRERTCELMLLQSYDY